MTNDLSTLNGSLVEMKDQLIYELGQKGVTASYDSTTGLLGLIGKISEIQQGGSCYHIAFSEASYTAVGGSATLEIYLQENYAPKSGATISVTGSDGSVYNGITNTNGIASVSVSVSAETIFTATYSNVSDTCTVTVASYIYYNAMTSDDNNWTQSSSSGISVTYGTDGCTVTGASTNDRYYSLDVSSLNLPDSFVVEYDITNYVLGAYNNSTEFCVYNSRVLVDNSDFHLRPMTNNTSVGSITVPSLPIHIRVEVDSDIKTYVNGTLFGTTSLSSSYKYIRFKTYNQRSMTVKNIVISAL